MTKKIAALILAVVGGSACTDEVAGTSSTNQKSLSYAKFSNERWCGPAYDRNANHELVTIGADDTFVASNANCPWPPSGTDPCPGICDAFSVSKGWGSLTQQQLNTAGCRVIIVNNQTEYGMCLYVP